MSIQDGVHLIERERTGEKITWYVGDCEVTYMELILIREYPSGVHKGYFTRYELVNVNAKNEDKLWNMKAKS